MQAAFVALVPALVIWVMQRRPRAAPKCPLLRKVIKALSAMYRNHQRLRHRKRKGNHQIKKPVESGQDHLVFILPTVCASTLIDQNSVGKASFVLTRIVKLKERLGKTTSKKVSTFNQFFLLTRVFLEKYNQRFIG